jgi:hypothetical protein
LYPYQSAALYVTHRRRWKKQKTTEKTTAVTGEFNNPSVMMTGIYLPDIF